MSRNTCALVVFPLCLLIPNIGFALEPGDRAPEFTAQGIDGKQYTLANVSKNSDVIVLCFTCNECPIAASYGDRFNKFHQEYQARKVTFVAINCNSQSENLDSMKKFAKERGLAFVYAFDKSGASATAFGAKVTPELFVIHKGKIAYKGAFDNELSGPSKHYVADAVQALLAGKEPAIRTTKAFGCGIRTRR